MGGGLVDQAGDDEHGQDGGHDDHVDDHPVLVLAGCLLAGAAGAGRAVGAHRGWAESPLHAMRPGGPSRHRPAPGPPPPGVVRSVSWKGDRAVRTGDGPGAAVGGTPPRTSADPTPVEPATPFGWAPPPPGWRPAPAPPVPPAPPTDDARAHQVDGSLGHQLGAGAAPTTRSSAWTWLLFAALGFLGGQVLAVLSVSLSAAVSGNLHALDGHRQDVRAADLVHRVHPGRPVGRVLRGRLAVVVGAGDEQPGPGLRAAVPVDRPDRCADRDRRAVPGGPGLRAHREPRAQLQPAVRRPEPET